jgi:hypothetical protein
VARHGIVDAAPRGHEAPVPIWAGHSVPNGVATIEAHMVHVPTTVLSGRTDHHERGGALVVHERAKKAAAELARD